MFPGGETREQLPVTPTQADVAGGPDGVASPAQSPC